MADYRENVWPVAVNYMFKENFDASVIIDAHEILNHNKLLSVQVVKISYTAIKSYKLNKNENKSRKLITSNNFSDLLKPMTVIMPMLELSKFVESITALSLLLIVMSWALTEIGAFFLSLLVRSYRECEFGNFDKIKNKNNTKKQNDTKKHKNFWLNFCLNKECPKLLCGLGICHRRRQTIPMWNSSGEKGILQGITVCLVSAVLSSM